MAHGMTVAALALRGNVVGILVAPTHGVKAVEEVVNGTTVVIKVVGWITSEVIGITTTQTLAAEPEEVLGTSLQVLPIILMRPRLVGCLGERRLNAYPR